MKNRKRNRMKEFDYSSNRLYFVSNCVKNNLCCFGNVVSKSSSVRTGRDLSAHHPENHHPEKSVMQLNSFGAIIKKQLEWLVNQYPYVEIHNYVIMPNHFHLIIEIDSLRVHGSATKIKSLSSIMGALKTTTSKQIRELGFEDFSWHRSFHDHIIRNEREFSLIFNYIDLNPQKWFQDKLYNSELKQF